MKLAIALVALGLSLAAFALSAVAYTRQPPRVPAAAPAGVCVDGIDPALIGDGWPSSMGQIITWVGQPDVAPNGVMSCPRGDYVAANP